MKELVEIIAKALADHPAEVRVKSGEGAQVTVLELQVHPEDLGKVIGRQGRTAKAIRTVLGAAGIKVKALMSIGHAGESAETVRDTEEWLVEHAPDDFDCT